MLALNRSLIRLDAHLRQGHWKRQWSLSELPRR